MKKITAVLLIMCVSLGLMTGCVKKNEYVGMEKIEALRNEASEYDSARYFITNVETDVLEQVFTFMYEGSDKKSAQIYLCEGVQGGEYYAEYSNGIELYREENGVGAIIPSSDDTYASYTRKDPHPYSTGELFFYVNGYIDSAEETTDADGNTLYIYTYNTEKINKALKSALTVFATSYAFDSDGNFVYFRQHNASETESYTYEITVDEINSVTEIENPVIVGGSATEETAE